MGTEAPVQITEPVTLHLTMLVDGELTTSRREYARFSDAHRAGKRNACMNGSWSVAIFGADDQLLTFWADADNIWRNHAAGRLLVTEDTRSCSCGGTPSLPTRTPEHLYHNPSMGWFWKCERCGSGAWFRVGR